MNQAGFLPVSGAQAGIWYGQQSSAIQGGYSTAQCLEFMGAVDIDILRQAVMQAIGEAEGLYENFVATDEGPTRRRPVQSPAQELPEVVDLRGQLHARTLAWQQMEARREAHFSLTQGPLYRQTIWRLADNHVLWWLNMHHVAADAWAYALIQQRAAEFYGALLNNTEVKPAWYGSVDRIIEEESRYAASDTMAQDREYWTSRFADDPDPVSLTGRFATAQAHALRCEKLLTPEQTRHFRERCTAHRQGLAEAILAASGAWYARMCQRPDVTLGVPMMGRMQRAALRAPVTQVNMLPLRLEDDFLATPQQWCVSATRELQALRRHQRYRHEWLLRDLGRRPGRRPLLGMHVNVLPFDPVGQWPGIRVQKHHLVAGPVDDLVFSVYLGGDSEVMRLALDANPALHDETELQWHLERLAMWLTAFMDQFETPITQLPLTTPRDIETLTYFNATDHPVETTHMATLFERQVVSTPSAVALVADGVTLDYQALSRRVQALSEHLIDEGVVTGDAVGIALPRSLDMQVALLAIHHVGATWLPLPLEYPDARLNEMIARATPRLVLTIQQYQGRFVGTPVLDLAATGMNRALAHASRLLVTGDAEQRDPQLGAYILFTSGSTGKPKGVVVEHHAIVNRILWMQEAYRLQEGDRVLQKTPNGFDVSVWEFLWPMVSGASLVMAREGGHRDPRYLIDTIISERITTLHFVPSMLDILLDEISARDIAQMNALRQVFVSGEALSRELEQRFLQLLPQVALHNLYGPTEAAIDVSAWHCRGEDARTSVPIGAPVWNTRLHVLDADHQPVPVGMAGELYISGRNLARGYLGQPTLTAERFIEVEPHGRLYRTGDLARWRFNGVLDYLGRIDHQVKLRGQRLELGEIESVLLAHEDVAHAVVTVHGSSASLVGYVVSSSGRNPDMEALKRHLARELPDYMVPGIIMLLEALPLSPNGKLDRRALPAPGVGDDSTLPTTPRQQVMANILAEVLGIERVGIRDNFFDLGGHSLSALQLVRRLNEALGLELTVAALFETPTIEGLEALDPEQAYEGGLGVLLPLRKTGSESPLFCIHPAGGLAWCYAGLARTLPAQYPLYGVQARGLLPGSALPVSMDEMARDYIRQIRRVQPQGPYCLLGWSVGGMIAHTMAALLENEGEEVRMLALLDAYPADLWRDMTPPDEGMALEALLRIAGLADELVMAEGKQSRRAQVIDLLQREGSALGQLSSETLDALVDVVINNSRLVRDTRHLTFNGNLHFFTAATPREEHWLNRSAWQPYVGGRIINLDMNATHPQLMQHHHLATIADHIVRALETREPVSTRL